MKLFWKPYFVYLCLVHRLPVKRPNHGVSYISLNYHSFLFAVKLLEQYWPALRQISNLVFYQNTQTSSRPDKCAKIRYHRNALWNLMIIFIVLNEQHKTGPRTRKNIFCSFSLNFGIKLTKGSFTRKKHPFFWALPKLPLPTQSGQLFLLLKSVNIKKVNSGNFTTF